MSDIPKAISINGIKYTVVLVPDLGSEPDANGVKASWFGHVSHTKQEIEIEADMYTDVQKVGLLHEAMHAMTHQAGHHDIDDWTEDRLIVCLSYGVVNMLRDNPKLLAYIMGGNDE